MKAGIYIGKILRTSLGASGKKGTPYVGIKWEVNGETIDSYTYLTEAAEDTARKVLRILGVDYDDPNADLLSLQDNPVRLAGLEAEIDVQEEEYNGVVRAKVQWINSLTREIDRTAFKAINDKFGKLRKEKGHKAPPKPAPTPPEEVEDLPF